MVTQIVRDIVVCHHTALNPTDVEWDEFTAALRIIRAQYGTYRCLVFSDGGGPSAKQREEARNAVGKDRGCVAVVSSSTLVRGVVSVTAWFGVNIAAFTPEHHARALAFIAATPEELLELRAAARLAVPGLTPYPPSGMIAFLEGS